MGLALLLLFQIHGQSDEVWPNRCGLLRAQLIDQPEYERLSSLPSLPLSQLLPDSIHTIEIMSASEVILPSRAILKITVNAQSKEKLIGELYSIPRNVLTSLSKDLGMNLDSAIAERIEGISSLTRQGLKVTPKALTCTSEFASTEQEIALSLLLKGGLQKNAPAGLIGYGFLGSFSWFAQWQDGSKIKWRLWNPIVSDQASKEEWMMVWTRYSDHDQIDNGTQLHQVDRKLLEQILTQNQLSEFKTSLDTLLKMSGSDQQKTLQVLLKELPVID